MSLAHSNCPSALFSWGPGGTFDVPSKDASGTFLELELSSRDLVGTPGGHYVRRLELT